MFPKLRVVRICKKYGYSLVEERKAHSYSIIVDYNNGWRVGGWSRTKYRAYCHTLRVVKQDLKTKKYAKKTYSKKVV